MFNHPALPAKAVDVLAKTRGAAAAAWLERLPAILTECERRWSLVVESPMANLSYNYVASVRLADGASAILKLSPADDAESQAESEALRIFDGRGAVRLLAADIDIGAALLEKLEPGTTLEDYPEPEATAIACRVMKKLWRPTPISHNFPTTKDWACGLARARPYLTSRHQALFGLIEQAEELFAQLHASSCGKPVLLHGDLHHGNILAAKREAWLAIDPKGVIGEPAYEVGAWLRNPLPKLLAMPNPQKILSDRLDLFSRELGCDRDRLCSWAFAQSVLSICWSLEDNENEESWAPMLVCADLLRSLLLV